MIKTGILNPQINSLLARVRIPQAIGLIRTGDTIQYANMILVSA